MWGDEGMPWSVRDKDERKGWVEGVRSEWEQKGKAERWGQGKGVIVHHGHGEDGLGKGAPPLLLPLHLPLPLLIFPLPLPILLLRTFGLPCLTTCSTRTCCPWSPSPSPGPGATHPPPSPPLPSPFHPTATSTTLATMARCHGSVLIPAIMCCTNTMLGAWLLARMAVEAGLKWCQLERGRVEERILGVGVIFEISFPKGLKILSLSFTKR